MGANGNPHVPLTTNKVVPTSRGTTRREFVTLAELGEETGTSARFWQKEIARGRLRALRFSNRITRIRRSDFERYLDSTAT